MSGEKQSNAHSVLILVASTFAVVAIVAVLAILTARGLYRIERKIVEQRTQEIQALVSSAQKHPHDLSFGNSILAIAEGDNDFLAVYATASLGDLGEAARPIIPRIARLMNARNGTVRREAARSLSRLGPISEDALPLLVAKIQSDSDYDVTYFAVEAIGAIGKPSALPVLRTKLADSDGNLSEIIQVEINRLEAIESTSSLDDSPILNDRT
ncbi:HEAT repeat domain-containing protein [Bremerella cremea]|uniref:HEAT repeat domain-containing protein n=1 Tax=Blastopirellula marina TaxID=124 RepID=A0A2S8FZQ0_9BACT|nr:MULTISPECIES: HEAT repeat domain-containing protein [Pirellulaceae]PQO37672.1 hypothetical protein C5Y83_06920 [Blastopirellula marina]RCS50059.1 HEAT repeat domain-containing protein [Bremerella cremea]